MKFLILTTLLVTWMNVKADAKYTDYEFQGYTKEKLEADELYRYEETTFNKFYKIEKNNEIYLKGLDLQGYEYVDPDDFIYESYYQKEPLYGFDNHPKIAIYAGENFKIDTIYLKGNDHIKSIVKNLFIKSKDTPIDYDLIEEPDQIKIDLKKDYNYIDINFDIDYDIDTIETFDFVVLHPTSNFFWQSRITLNPEYATVHADIMEASDFQAFIQKNFFSFYEVLNYFFCDATKYRHYDVTKNYYIDSENESLDGYEYDKDESYTMYKIYKRSKTEEDSTEIQNDKKEENFNPLEPPKEENSLKQESIIKESPKSNVTYIYNYKDQKEYEDEIQEENSAPICNCHYTPLTDVPTANDDCEIKENNIVIKIGIILLMTSLIEFIIYTTCVKRTNKNG